MTFGISLKNSQGREVVGLGSALQVVDSNVVSITSRGQDYLNNSDKSHFGVLTMETAPVFNCIGFAFPVGSVRGFCNIFRSNAMVVASETGGSLAFDRVDLVSKLAPNLQLNGYGMWVKNINEDSYSFSDRYPIISAKSSKLIGAVTPGAANRTFTIPEGVTRVYLVCSRGGVHVSGGAAGPWPARGFFTTLTRTSATTVSISSESVGGLGTMPMQNAHIPSTPQMALFS